MTPRDFENFHTTRNTVGAHFHAEHGTKTLTSTKNSLKKANRLNLVNQATIMVETFLIHNSRLNFSQDKHFLQKG